MAVVYSEEIPNDYILKDFKHAQFLTDCTSGTTACKDKSFISETSNFRFFDIRCPVEEKKRVAVDVILTFTV